MELIWSELTAGLPDTSESARVLIRMLAAMGLGAAVGYQRERVGKEAGFRTHILVALGTALFVIVCKSVDMDLDGLSRVIQGIATGIGFIGTGTILKREDKSEIHGLTTAAGLFMTGAVGVAAGLGRVGLAIVATLLTLVVLSVLGRIELGISRRAAEKAKSDTAT